MQKMAADTVQDAMDSGPSEPLMKPSDYVANHLYSSDSDSAHSSGTDTVVVCPDVDSNAVSPTGGGRLPASDNSSGSTINASVSRTGENKENVAVKNAGAAGAIRPRPHNHTNAIPKDVPEPDRRSEASSEQTRVSKFKVVKLESKAPYCRGRWQCFDFHDRPKEQSKLQPNDRPAADPSATSVVAPPATAAATAPAQVPSASSSVSDPLEVPSNLHTKPSKFKVTAVHLPVGGGVPGPPPVVISKGAPTDSSDSTSVSDLSVRTNVLSNGEGESATGKDAAVFVSDSNAALSAELSRRTTIDVGANGMSEISGISLDNKIRQCMDLVGNHLIIAVRGELETVSSELAKLRDKVEQLEFENNALRSENAILRSAAAGSDAVHRSQPSRKK
ncbi:sperm acrosome developmental regulator-like [Paramacrobiotus metropolitanus]|uniref:sperm acrosome developmental regulator-like n=1 Tax=Paramacrobiotus metropolitanus TaxID=2943436 RepID=UPI002445B3AF|nr:sperm acrosome developmental regulator-like [Paramacrobiotus metropolitanus]XP_055331859.1 sperm acrosome developmental regulator-like [Paramacrobiotus metropolitanus]XP_055331860.1 sperm acrosome developmental regulator-like [Paramacrobiotus metropolitanus]XP_055331861.1 sperm acrosome developmental regulator-like [Paramacrobiotus metropolitanus]XP_055331862.1 sperm acrosome developmental regulator-like [Paramacrobiotus metropolitanus]